MIDTKQAIENAPRSHYYGRQVPWYFHLSLKIERWLNKFSRLLEDQRKLSVRRTMKEMWPVDTRVVTDHGKGTVVKNTYLYNTFAMGGWIETDVRYDGAPITATSYPDVGHYNQIFLEAERGQGGQESE